jgi:ATP-dependent Clp protease ATP-binding subunit ClpC
VFERYTEGARQVLSRAQAESRALGHEHCGPEHILLGFLGDEDGWGALTLGALHVPLDEVRAHVTRIVSPGVSTPTGRIPFTLRAKKVLQLALTESSSLGHEHIGPEHIFLGLLRMKDGVAGQVLIEVGLKQKQVRKEIIGMLNGPDGAPEGATTRTFPKSLARLTHGSKPSA